MTVDTSHRKYSTLRIQFRPTSFLFRLGRRLDKIAKRSNLLKSLRKWLKKSKKENGNIVEHKIKIPVEVCTQFSNARALFNNCSSCSGDGGCQLFINESWSGLNPYTCTPRTVESSENNSLADASSVLCFNQGFIDDIDSIRKSLSAKNIVGREVYPKDKSIGSKTQSD